MALLERFYDPNSGGDPLSEPRVRIFGTDQLIGLREKMQTNPIFHGKIDGFV